MVRAMKRYGSINDTFPSFMGTGTEDYYNCSWAPVVPFATPFGRAPGR